MKIIHIKQPYRKTYTLQLNKEGDLVIKTNRLFTKRKLDQVVEKHKTWIDKQLLYFSENQAARDSFKVLNGVSISLLGKNYTFHIINSENKNISIKFINDTIQIKLNKENHYDQSELKSALSKFLKKSSKDLFIDRVNFYANKYGFEFNNISIKEQKSKWGSCSSKKNLNFNWRLIFAPMEVLDYVVVHEVCHLKEMNHSKRFWDLVKIQCPDYKRMRKWLKENSERTKIL